MSENRAVKGGDRKSIKYIGSKNGSFLTDFFPKKNGKNVHLLGKEVIESQGLIDMKAEELKMLQDQKKEMIELRTKLAVERCTRDDANPDWFRNPKTKEDMQLALDWMNIKDNLLKIDNNTENISKHLLEIREAHTNILKSSLENTKHWKQSEDAKLIAKRNSMSSRTNERKLQLMEPSDNVAVATGIADNLSIIPKAAVIQTDVGVVRTNDIPVNGTSVSGVLDMSPWIKFYSGNLFQTEKNTRVRAKPHEHIFSYAGFKSDDGKCYQLTNIEGYNVTAVSGKGRNIDIIKLNKNMENKTGLNWVISSIDTSTAVDNTNYSYGDPVMPAKSSRKRTYVPYKYVPVPDNKRKRAKKCNKVSKPNKPYKRYKTSMKSTDALLENVKAVEPILAEKLVVKNDGEGSYIFDECCKKKMPYVRQNILKHIRTNVHKSRMKEMAISQEEINHIGVTFGKSDETTKMKIEFKKAQMKSFSSRKTLDIYTKVAGRHLSEGTLYGTNHWMEYVPSIHTRGLQRNFDYMTKLSKPIVLIEDSTTLVDDQVGICSRMIDPDSLFITQGLVDIWSLLHHTSGRNTAFIMEQAWKRCNRTRSDIIATPADRVSSNSVAYKELLQGNDDIFAIGCFSHTLDHVGKRFKCPELDQFMIATRELVSISTDAKRLFRENDTEDKNLAGYAKIRWWNNWVQMYQIYNNGCESVNCTATQLLSNDKYRASSRKSTALWKDPITRSKSDVQLAANIDYGMPFVYDYYHKLTTIGKNQHVMRS